MHKICTNERVNRCMNHYPHWMDTTQSIQWMSVTQPNLVEEKPKRSGQKPPLTPRETARTHWAAHGKPSHPLDGRNTPTLPSAELPATEKIRRTEENLEDHDYIGRTTVKALRVHTTMVEINRRGIVNSKPECNPRPIFYTCKFPPTNVAQK